MFFGMKGSHERPNQVSAKDCSEVLPSRVAFTPNTAEVLPTKALLRGTCLERNRKEFPKRNKKSNTATPPDEFCTHLGPRTSACQNGWPGSPDARCAECARLLSDACRPAAWPGLRHSQLGAGYVARGESPCSYPTESGIQTVASGLPPGLLGYCPPTKRPSTASKGLQATSLTKDNL